MSSSVSDYRFQFEIAIVLVIGLLIYVFVSLAMVAGYHLWNISSKVDAVRLKQKQQPHGAQPANGLQNTAPAGSGAESSDNESTWELQKKLRESQKELKDNIRWLNQEEAKSDRYYNAAIAARDALVGLEQYLDVAPADLAAANEALGKLKGMKNIKAGLEKRFCFSP